MINPTALHSPPALTAMAPTPTLTASPIRAVASPYATDHFQAPQLPDPPGPTTGERRGLFERAKPMEIIGGIALHVGGGAVIAGGIGAGVALLAGGAVGTGLAIGAGIGAVLGGLWAAAVLSIAG